MTNNEIMNKESKINYKETLNLPKTEFSMKANLPQREPETLKKWEEDDIYSAILKKRENSEEQFILHDGPPYANGHIHMGHVLNKILKDITVKYYTMKGFASPFVPGWDCHGLPVEHQLFKDLNMTKHDIDQVTFRKKAYKYAMKFVDIQKKEFKRLGIFADWDNPYLTLTKDYEADILVALADLTEKGYIYKDLKPVNWCAKCETALAEAEVEYEDKVSPSIYVKFPAAGNIEGKSVYFVIWTTTPWTLIANVAVALHPEFEYSFIDTGDEIWVMASDLVPRLMKGFGIEEYKVVDRAPGKDLAGRIDKARHPFLDRGSQVVLADYVTKEEGTGCVHTAPGHGQDDYKTGKKYGLPVIMPVDSTGKFMKEAGEFAGRNVLEANSAIVDKMRSEGSLVKSSDVTHSYPHCWRCKEPIIFRATKQWFMNVDHLDLRKKLSAVIEKGVEWIPSIGSERIGSMVKLRPDWCLSRQRYWGVPIPAFECTACGETFTEASKIKKVSDLTRESGADVWFEKSIDEMFPEGVVCPSCGGKEISKENDILDVWFDSGVSHKAVLEARDDLRFPADLYLEGSDQHRGWFQAALITSMGMNGEPPYRKVLTHGFVVDGDGKKMAKSIGNVISPQDVMKKYGADILRLWVASSDYEGDIKISSETLERLADGYRKMRNTFRFLLSNTYDFDPDKDAVDLADLTEMDKWMMSRLAGILEEVEGYYERFEFYKVYRTVYNFCVYEVSSFYLDVLKDVLYILTPDALIRRSAQTVIFNILNSLIRVMAPILVFTSEEVWGHVDLSDKEETVHAAYWPDKELTASWKNEQLDKKWRDILSLRDTVMKLLEVKREEGLIGSSLGAAIVLYTEDDAMEKFVKDNIELIPVLFKVSQAEIKDTQEEGMEDAPGIPLKIAIKKAEGEKCQRCWNFNLSVGKHEDLPEVCDRCHDVISKRSHNG